MISVIIIDENPMFRSGLERLLTAHDVTIVGDAQTGAAGITLTRQHKPQIALINAQLPDMTGEAICRCIDRRFPATRMIFFLSPIHWPTLSRLIETPAQGFLAKEACYRLTILCAFAKQVPPANTNRKYSFSVSERIWIIWVT